MRLDDPQVVRAEYASEEGLRARLSAYEGGAGIDARDVAFAAVAEVAPRRVLEVGCGWGEFAERVARELGAEVVAVDLSVRMVELARERGVDARVGDVCSLDLADGSFDCAVANWMLYHVRDLDRALAGLARALRRPGGRLVATTNSLRHLEELWSLVGRDRANEPLRFFAENGEAALREHFPRVERRDVTGEILFDAAAARRYVAASVAHKHLARDVPEFEGTITATRRNAIFVADLT